MIVTFRFLFKSGFLEPLIELRDARVLLFCLLLEPERGEILQFAFHVGIVMAGAADLRYFKISGCLSFITAAASTCLREQAFSL